MITIAWALALLEVVPKLTIALPEFKKLWDELIVTFSKSTDQQTLQQAYDLALSDAADAHADLQTLIAEHK